MSAFIDAHRERFGVELICRTIGVSASAYYARATGRRSRRAVVDERLVGRIRELHADNYLRLSGAGCGERCTVPASRSGAAASSA